MGAMKTTSENASALHYRHPDAVPSGIRLNLPAVAGFNSVKKVTESMTIAATLLQSPSYAQTGIRHCKL
jgi:hypothetical protein